MSCPELNWNRNNVDMIYNNWKKEDVELEISGFYYIFDQKLLTSDFTKIAIMKARSFFICRKSAMNVNYSPFRDHFIISKLIIRRLIPYFVMFSMGDHCTQRTTCLITLEVLLSWNIYCSDNSGLFTSVFNTNVIHVDLCRKCTWLIQSAILFLNT